MPRLRLAALAALAPAAGAAGWPQFRGSNRDGVAAEKGLLKAWPRGGPKLVWRCPGIGEGFSSVSVAGDLVYTMGDWAGAAHVFAISRDRGKVLWQRRV